MDVILQEDHLGGRIRFSKPSNAMSAATHGGHWAPVNNSTRRGGLFLPFAASAFPA